MRCSIKTIEMSELQKFLFDGLPVRGMIVRLTDSWQEVLRRREAGGAYPQKVTELLGEMAAASLLMQANIKFNGSVIVQIMGDGPVKLAVAEATSELSFRATAKVVGDVADNAGLADMINVLNGGRCAITLDPKDKLPGQQPYQGVVPLFDDRGEKLTHFSQVLEHYMLQSEQLDTKLVLAANDKVAAGLLIQRLPMEGAGNLEGQIGERSREDLIGLQEDYNRISILAASLKREELLELDIPTILHRLFWEESTLHFEPQQPKFACTCSRERVSKMLKSLGRNEIDDIVRERGNVEVGCEFCGAQYAFDPVDALGVFTPERDLPPGTSQIQ
jgi:molecular chaperone Hsp33